jgi:hypothetical protein
MPCAGFSFVKRHRCQLARRGQDSVAVAETGTHTLSGLMLSVGTWERGNNEPLPVAKTR